MTNITINKKNGQKLNAPRVLNERFATLADVAMIAEFQQEIRATALKANDGSSVFAADDEEFITEIITSKDGAIVLYYDGDEFVGFFELTIPDDKEHLEEYLVKEYKPETDYNTVGVYESVAVVPEYRGNGFQQQIAIRMEEIARERGIKVMTGTVHPENPYSVNNFKASGYEILAEVEFHYGHRYIVYKEIG